MPGAWTLKVKTDKEYTGSVSVVSDLLFKYGFSKIEPKSIIQTAFVPLLASKNYLAISPSDDTKIGTLSEVELFVGATKLQTIPLTRKIGSDGEVMYVTTPFDLPNGGFRFYVSTSYWMFNQR